MHLGEGLTERWRRVKGQTPAQLRFWLVALVLGIVAGGLAVGFRMFVAWVQTAVYGADEKTLASFASELHWAVIVGVPVFGGLVVGLILHRFTHDGRARSVADTIEGAALNQGRVGIKDGLASTLASAITLATGGSTGREGPVVHLAAVVSSWVSDRMNADGITARDLMGCAVAAAVSASFNAPIAGALFALEVVLRHFAINAFAPIVIASVSGAVVSRLTIGVGPEFVLPHMGALAFYLELPAFLLLGLLSGIVAVLLMWSCLFADKFGTDLTQRLGIARWLRPAIAGGVLGAIAIYFPHIIGVGYETTTNALSGDMILHEAIVFAIVKCVAVAVTMGGRMGGGIFSPSLMIGALVGLAFGIVATTIFPEVSGLRYLYALAGMGAVAAAVLGAPISTTLIVFELTGDWQAGIAVMVAVSISTALASRMVHRSFFITQLERRGIHLAEGPQGYLLSLYRVGMVMKDTDTLTDAMRHDLTGLVERGIYVPKSATLELANSMMESHVLGYIPVVETDGDTPKVEGVIHQVDVLKVFNKALAAAAAEEHR